MREHVRAEHERHHVVDPARLDPAVEQRGAAVPARTLQHLAERRARRRADSRTARARSSPRSCRLGGTARCRRPPRGTGSRRSRSTRPRRRRSPARRRCRAWRRSRSAAGRTGRRRRGPPSPRCARRDRRARARGAGSAPAAPRSPSGPDPTGSLVHLVPPVSVEIMFSRDGTTLSGERPAPACDRESVDGDERDTPGVAPDDAFFWDGAAEDRLLVQRCADCGTLRHPPAPMCGDVRFAASGTPQESSGRRTDRVVDLVAAPEPTRRRPAHRDPRATRGGHPPRLEPRRPTARRAVRRPARCVVEFRDDRGTPHALLPGRGRDRHHRRRHRRHRVLEGVGPQRDAARGGGVPRRDPRRRPHPGRHRRHGHLHRRRQRRAGADAQPRRRAESRGGRARRAAAPARARRCSTRSRRSTSGLANTVLVYRAFNERSRLPLRATAPRPQDRRAARLVPQLRRRHAGEDVRALVPSLHARVTARPTRTSAATRCRRVATPRPTRRRGSTSARSRSTTTRRRAGSSSRCCASTTAARRATAASRWS